LFVNKSNIAFDFWSGNFNKTYYDFYYALVSDNELFNICKTAIHVFMQCRTMKWYFSCIIVTKCHFYIVCDAKIILLWGILYSGLSHSRIDRGEKRLSKQGVSGFCRRHQETPLLLLLLNIRRAWLPILCEGDLKSA